VNRNPAYAVAGGVIGALVVLAVYWPARANGFLWDDWEYLVRPTIYRDPSQWLAALFHPPLGDAIIFRPVAMASFMLQLWTGQLDAGPYHIANLLLHAANALLVALLAWRLFGGDGGRAEDATYAALCGLLYGLHPALTESALWISCRFDLLATFFLSLALLVDGGRTDIGWRRAVMVGALFLAAMLSKETAVGFLFALPLVHLAIGQSHASAAGALSSRYRVYVALLLACAAYLALRFTASSDPASTMRVTGRLGDFGMSAQHLLAVAASFAQHLADALWPFTNLLPSRALTLPIDAGRFLGKFTLLAGLVAAALWAIRSAPRARAPALLLFAFLGALLPVSNVLPLPSAAPNEIWSANRYLTFPLVLLCIAVHPALRVMTAALAAHAPRTRPLPWLVCGAWLASCALIVHATIPLWKNDEAFFRWLMTQEPPRAWHYMNLGVYYSRSGRLQEARENFFRALELNPTDDYAWHNVGVMEAALGNVESARKAHRRALELNPAHPRSRERLGELERRDGR
jgi:hypothetical protein